eukprot:7133623-Alexandrium_andersonii.AAC.1
MTYPLVRREAMTIACDHGKDGREIAEADARSHGQQHVRTEGGKGWPLATPTLSPKHGHKQCAPNA